MVLGGKQMKKILAVTLAILMLLPMFASFAYAGSITIPEGTPVENILSMIDTVKNYRK